MIPLSDLKPGQSAVISRTVGTTAMTQRLAEFGFFEGETIEFLTAAPLGDPIEIRLGNTRLTLRKADAIGVSVTPIESHSG
jgi:ferrous iron transport protein A